MKLEFDEEKRLKTLKHRNLDFAAAQQLFEGRTLTIEDDREDYGERRYQTIGTLDAKMVMVVWTPRETARRIISMRHCNERERERHQAALDRS